MKFIKNHLMFILPLMAILLGIEFYLVFDRTTNSYEKGLKEGYTMFVVSKKPMTLSAFKALNTHIESFEAIKRKDVVSDIVKGISKNNEKAILKALPFFYNVGLDAYVNTVELDKIKADLEANADIERVETFGNSYRSAYKLFAFIKFTLKLFIGFMGIVSLFLIIKQMEIWKYAHKQRMQVMEIFGAPLMLRSGVLFKVAVTDAIVATLITAMIFLYIKFEWAAKSGIDIIVKNKENLFRMSDMGILLGAALVIVIIAVYSVVFSSSGVDE
ncbi:cell division protein FtsX [Sulfurovum sp.]|uniref:cell division protein FtsX n=1 Tax=Sulfurovum sp. TaxID=1969726 RepID=UPI0025CFE13E|nr:cell division protein FtsX [Sulfurovum sp.]